MLVVSMLLCQRQRKAIRVGQTDNLDKRLFADYPSGIKSKELFREALEDRNLQH